MYSQQFKLYAGEVAQFGKQYVPELENISVKPADTITAIMRGVVKKLDVDVALPKRFVAVGNCGDCVIYENDTISHVSDSG